MQYRNIVLGLLAAALLSGCGLFTRKQVDYKAGAVVAAPLEVPPNLIVPESEQRYLIPGADGKKVANYSEYTKQKTEQPCAKPADQPAVASAEVIVRATVQSERGKNTSILLSTPFDRSWRIVGLAMERAHWIAKDMDRSKGLYFIEAKIKEANSKISTREYRVVVVTEGKTTEVSVSDAHGKQDTAALGLIKQLFDNLGD